MEFTLSVFQKVTECWILHSLTSFRSCALMVSWPFILVSFLSSYVLDNLGSKMEILIQINHSYNAYMCYLKNRATFLKHPSLRIHPWGLFWMASAISYLVLDPSVGCFTTTWAFAELNGIRIRKIQYRTPVVFYWSNCFTLLNLSHTEHQ